jgi:hypothetical protein
MRAALVRLAGTALLTTCVAVCALADPAAAANPQTITFGPLSNRLYGSSPFTISATSSGAGQQQSVIHGSATNTNACYETTDPPVTAPDNTTMSIGMSADASPQPHLGQIITLTSTKVTETVPSDLVAMGYVAGIVDEGTTVPTTLRMTVAASNTFEGTHAYAATQGTVTLHFNDPDGVPHNGDETPAQMDVTIPLPDTDWHPINPSLPVIFRRSRVWRRSLCRSLVLR